VRGWFFRVLLVTVLLQTAVYAIRPMVSYKALSLGADNFDIGMIAAAYASLSLLVAVPIGRWVDRLGEPKFILGGSVAIVGVSLALLTIDSLIALALSQAALGFGHIMSVVGTQTLVANWGDPTRRDGRFGVFTVIVSLGQLAGPALAGFVAGGSLTAIQAGTGGGAGSNTPAVFWSTAVVTAVGMLVAATLVARRARRPAEDSRTGCAQRPPTEPNDDRARKPVRSSSFHAVGRVLRIPSMPQAMIASLTVLTTVDLLTVYLPVYGEANGISVETVGLLLAVRAAASMASRLLMLPMIRHFGRRSVLVTSIVMPAVALGLLPLLEDPSILYVAMAVAGFGLGLGQPISLSWVADQAPATLRGTALGVRLSGNRLGQVVLPAAVGVIAGASGLTAVFVSLSVLLALSAAAVMAAPFGQAAHGQTDP
jgi:MFS family permease